MSRNPNFGPLLVRQRAKKESTREQILQAMGTMEQEIAEHGLYPFNDGKVTMTEVLKRASVGSTTLRNVHHHSTRDLVLKWLKDLGGRAPTKVAGARKASREKIAWYEEALRKVNAEAMKWRTDLAALMDENLRLREQINGMGITKDPKVIGIKSRAQGHE